MDSRSPTPIPAHERRNGKRRRPLPEISDSDSDLPEIGTILSQLPSHTNALQNKQRAVPESARKNKGSKTVHGYKRPRVTVKLGTFEISDDEDQTPSRKPVAKARKTSKPSASDQIDFINLCSDDEPAAVSPMRSQVRTVTEGNTIVILTSEDEAGPSTLPASRVAIQPHREEDSLIELFSPSPPRATTPDQETLTTPDIIMADPAVNDNFPSRPTAGPSSPATTVDLDDNEPETIRTYAPGELQAIYDRALATVESEPPSQKPQPIVFCENPVKIPTFTHLIFSRSVFGAPEHYFSSPATRHVEIALPSASSTPNSPSPPENTLRDIPDWIDTCTPSLMETGPASAVPDLPPNVTMELEPLPLSSGQNNEDSVQPVSSDTEVAASEAVEPSHASQLSDNEGYKTVTLALPLAGHQGSVESSHQSPLSAISKNNEPVESRSSEQQACNDTVTICPSPSKPPSIDLATHTSPKKSGKTAKFLRQLIDSMKPSRAMPSQADSHSSSLETNQPAMGPSTSNFEHTPESKYKQVGSAVNGGTSRLAFSTPSAEDDNIASPRGDCSISLPMGRSLSTVSSSTSGTMTPTISSSGSDTQADSPGPITPSQSVSTPTVPVDDRLLSLDPSLGKYGDNLSDEGDDIMSGLELAYPDLSSPV